MNKYRYASLIEKCSDLEFQLTEVYLHFLLRQSDSVGMQLNFLVNF